MAQERKPLVERFWGKAKRAGPEQCWEWTAALTTKGYGKIKIKGRVVEAHRVSLDLAAGSIPEGLCVLHSCDNRRCVNPNHLRVGTKKDNAVDREGRERSHDRTGENNGRAKLTARLVGRIRAEYRGGQCTQKQLASRYGVGRSTIGRAVRRQNWQGV